MIGYNINKIKVEYEIFGKNDVNERFDSAIEKLANSFGLEFWGSGFDFKTKIRDLEFGSLRAESKESEKN